MCMLALLVVLRAAEDQLLERGTLPRDVMEVLLLLDVTGRDHGLRTPGNNPRDGLRADARHLKTRRKCVAMRRLVRRLEWLACHPHDRDDRARGDRFTVGEQLQQPADADRRDHRTAGAGSEERPPTDPGAGRTAATVFLP